MSSSGIIPSIVYLRLDPDYDPIFTTNAELTDLAAVAQAILTRLRLFEGEWWENLGSGTPMFQEILGQRATQSGQEIMSLALAARVSGTPFVSGVTNIQTTYEPIARKFTFNCIAQTAFGTVPVSFQPGAIAGVDG